MRKRLTSIVAAVALIVPALVILTAVPAAANVFSNPASIALNDPNSQSNGNNNATATPYPSTISVSGLTGTVNHVAVTLNNVSYSHSQDIDALLVGPGGQTLILVANLGPNSGPTAPATNSTLTLSDAGSLPSMLTPWGASNTFKPVNFGGFNEVWEPPAPPGPYGDPGANGTGATLASIFNGTNPNGTWSLFVITTSGGDGTGAIAGGWSIDVTTASVAATTTTISSSNNPSFTAPVGNSVTFTSTVKKTSDSSNVNEGTATFTDGGSPISGCTAVAVSAGVAACTTSFTTEGNHVIVANYNGTANFGPSHSPNLTQVVNNHTTVTGSNFCNTGSITLNNPPTTVADATPYPSNLFVSGLAGVVNHVAVTLNNVTYSHSQDIDVLLVSPSGQTLILVANLGPNSGPGAAVNNQPLTFSDAGVLPPSGQTTSWGALTTVKPVNFGGFNEVWGPPAPPGPYGDPGTSGSGATFASAFNGSTASGTWSLYVITTASGDGTGTIAGGWCANITAAPIAATTTALSSDNNPSFTTSPGNGVTFTATVKKASDSSNVNEGTVAFTDGGSPISGCTAVAVSAGSATCTTSFSAEGVHNIVAQYNGTANFGASSANLAQVVNNHTTVTGNSFCNTGSITLNNPPNTVADATPYPSNIFVTGRPGPLQHLTVTLNNTTYSHSQDIDALLVGPGGQTLILVANLGPNSGPQAPASNSTLTLDDAGILPPSGQATPWGSTPTFKPVNYGGFNETWGPPAPPGPYGDPGTTGTGATLSSVFNGTVPNGTWSLYVITTAPGDGTGAMAGGWCLGITSPQPPTLTKAFGAPSVRNGGTTSLSFTITNPNASASLSGIGFTDNLPNGLAVATPNGLSGSCGGGTITADTGATSVALSGATLAGGASCTFSVNVTATSTGTKVNTTSAPSSVEGGSGTAATATLVVAAPASLTKAFGAPSVALNGSTSLTFTLSNPNATIALTGVGFTDNLPAGLVVSTPNGLTGSCGGGTITATAGSSSVALSGATLAGGATCTFSVNVTGTTAGAKVNTTSTVSSDQAGAGSAATATLTVNSGPPQITKSFGAATIALNGSTSLSFTISNPVANGTSTGIGFTDSLPAGLVVSTPNGLSGSCGGGTITADVAATSVALSGATLAAGASCTFSVNVTGTTAGVKNNSVTVSSTSGGTGNTSNATVTVVAPPNLFKQFGASSIPLNGTTTLIFSVENPNSSASLTGVGFTDTLPAGLVVATPNGLSGSCDGGTITATAGSSSVSLAGASFGPLPGPTSTCTFAVNVTGTTAGSKVNTTSAVTSNEGGNGAPATATLVVVAPPQIAKSFGPTAIALNGTTTLSFTITNPNAGTSLTGVAFTDTLPSGLVVSTPNGLSGSCGGGTITANTGASSVALSGATLAAGSSCTFSVNVTGTTSGAKNNSVTVSSTNGGTGNTATATVSVALPPQITKSFGAATIALNGSTSLSFTISNPSANGTFSLSGIGFTDSLPAGLVVSTPNGLSGSCGGGTITANSGATSVALSGATLAAGASCTFSVNVTGTTAGVKNNSVTVTSSNAGTGNTSNATVTVVAPPTIAKAFGASSIPFGGTTSLSFTLTNPNNTVALSGVGFTDNLPAGLVVATPNGLSGSCGGGTITATAGSSSVSLSGATLAAGASCTFSVNVLATSAGTKVNTTSAVTSGNGGTGLTATATLTVTRAPTTTTVTASPTNPSFGSPVTFTATVVPSGPNGTGVGPTGTVSFFLDGQATPVAVVPLSGGMASFTTSGLGSGTHTVTATYSGDANFLPSSSTTQAVVTVTCTTTITGGHTGTLVLGPGSTCVTGGTITGPVIVPKGSSLDLEGVKVTGNISASGAASVRICGTSSGSVTITGSTGFVLVGDAGDDGCAPNTISGGLNLQNNTGGVEAIGNHVSGSVVASGNSGTGPFPEDTAPDITGNGP